MTRVFFVLFIVFLFSFESKAYHGKGAVLIYEYVSSDSAKQTTTYKITLRMYCSIDDNRTFNTNVETIRIYDALTNVLISTLSAPIISRTRISNTSSNPCLSPKVTVDYVINDYAVSVELNNNTAGYLLSHKEYRRASSIVNFVNSSNYGIINYNYIPGAIGGIVYRNNSSPLFAVTDTTVICYNSFFSYNVSATDPNGDSLSYTFCDAKGDNYSNQNDTNWTPPFADMPYSSGFSGSQPMGSNVTIDPITGVISGTAPSETGFYVLAVCVSEYRKGILIGTTKKEIQVTVANCALTAAKLKVDYTNCDSYDFTFQNESSASNVTSYLWDFGVPGTSTDISASPQPTYTYPQAGSYTLKLVVTNSGGCKDSTTSLVKVYPGFTPGFSVTGSCFQNPFIYTNNTIFNPLDSALTWSWDFGDALMNNTDTSSSKNASYIFSKAGTYTTTLKATSIRGCVKTISNTVLVNDKPYLKLPFTDTLICSIDSLPLKAIIQSGTYNWTIPNKYYAAGTENTLSPLVFPKDTTIYTITVQDKGCIDSGKIKVNVLDFITVKFKGDTVLCATDTIILRPISDALSYAWTEIAGGTNTLNNYFTKNPKAFPTTTTTYRVTANLGYCQDKSTVTIRVAPYPTVNAGNDTLLCYGDNTKLHGTVKANHYAWIANTSLQDTLNLNPLVEPTITTAYYLTGKDSSYCPKTVTDTVVVYVTPEITVNAGSDLFVAFNQAVPLKASSNFDTTSVTYLWEPAIFLSTDTINNPILRVTNTQTKPLEYKVTVTDKNGCSGSDYITIKAFSTGPDILVPSGFTPNNDTKNDVLKPIPIGIQTFQYLKIFNRYGQQVFTTSNPSYGWDGYFNGVQQSAGTFVYIARGIDYSGNVIERKGVTVLMR